MIILEKIGESSTNPFDNTDVKMTIHFKELPNLDELLDTVKDFLVACGYGIERIEAYYPGDNLATTSKLVSPVGVEPTTY
jgi:hypothetical protein